MAGVLRKVHPRRRGQRGTMNGVPCLSLPKGLDAERVAVLTIEVIKLKVLFCRSRKSKNILRKACQILLSDDDIMWVGKTYRSMATQTVFFCGTYQDFLEQECPATTGKICRYTQTIEKGLTSPGDNSPPLTESRSVQTTRKFSWSKSVQTNELCSRNVSCQASVRSSCRPPVVNKSLPFDPSRIRLKGGTDKPSIHRGPSSVTENVLKDGARACKVDDALVPRSGGTLSGSVSNRTRISEKDPRLHGKTPNTNEGGERVAEVVEESAQPSPEPVEPIRLNGDARHPKNQSDLIEELRKTLEESTVDLMDAVSETKEKEPLESNNPPPEDANTDERFKLVHLNDQLKLQVKISRDLLQGFATCKKDSSLVNGKACQENRRYLNQGDPSSTNEVVVRSSNAGDEIGKARESRNFKVKDSVTFEHPIESPDELRLLENEHQSSPCSKKTFLVGTENQNENVAQMKEIKNGDTLRQLQYSLPRDERQDNSENTPPVITNAKENMHYTDECFITTTKTKDSVQVMHLKESGEILKVSIELEVLSKSGRPGDNLRLSEGDRQTTKLIKDFRLSLNSQVPETFVLLNRDGHLPTKNVGDTTAKDLPEIPRNRNVGVVQCNVLLGQSQVHRDGNGTSGELLKNDIDTEQCIEARNPPPHMPRDMATQCHLNEDGNSKEGAVGVECTRSVIPLTCVYSDPKDVENRSDMNKDSNSNNPGLDIVQCTHISRAELKDTEKQPHLTEGGNSEKLEVYEKVVNAVQCTSAIVPLSCTDLKDMGKESPLPGDSNSKDPDIHENDAVQCTTKGDGCSFADSNDVGSQSHLNEDGDSTARPTVIQKMDTNRVVITTSPKCSLPSNQDSAPPSTQQPSRENPQDLTVLEEDVGKIRDGLQCQPSNDRETLNSNETITSDLQLHVTDDSVNQNHHEPFPRPMDVQEEDPDRDPHNANGKIPELNEGAKDEFTEKLESCHKLDEPHDVGTKDEKLRDGDEPNESQDVAVVKVVECVPKKQNQKRPIRIIPLDSAHAMKGLHLDPRVMKLLRDNEHIIRKRLAETPAANPKRLRLQGEESLVEDPSTEAGD